MNWKKNTYEVTILEKHLDSFGHMNNAVYFELFEEARWQFTTEAGYGYEQVQRLGIGPTILEIKVRYRHEIKLRQKICIVSEVLKYDGKIGILSQSMHLGDSTGRLLCEAEFKFALFDLNKRKIIAPSIEWLKAMGALD